MQVLIYLELHSSRITRRNNNDAIAAQVRRILERCLYVDLLDVVAVNDRLRCLSEMHLADRLQGGTS
ncbi:MAG: hypothetical protein OXH96_05845 [Spirochaetaceae bacterium]|nr:hypothetical protein [Spirochaetaceae bacterium]